MIGCPTMTMPAKKVYRRPCMSRQKEGMVESTRIAGAGGQKGRTYCQAKPFGVRIEKAEGGGRETAGQRVILGPRVPTWAPWREGAESAAPTGPRLLGAHPGNVRKWADSGSRRSPRPTRNPQSLGRCDGHQFVESGAAHEGLLVPPPSGPAR
jgi:hypothetical protein